MSQKNLKTLVAMFALPLGILAYGIGANMGRDAMVEAAAEGNLNRIKLLFFLGINLSQVGWEDHFTPLTVAAYRGDRKTVAFLLKMGADPNVPDDHHETAMKIAERQHDTQMRVLLKSHFARRN
jgi:ankyrin repeat protein